MSISCDVLIALIGELFTQRKRTANLFTSSFACSAIATGIIFATADGGATDLLGREM
jgi:hypothetical protein